MSLHADMLERIEDMPPAIFERWRSVCYLDSPANQQLADPGRSVVVLGPPGSGFSTALALVPLQGVLTYGYPPSIWPGQAEAFTKAASHFEQLMGLVTRSLGDQLQGRRGLVERVDADSHLCLAWLNERYRGPRQREHWLRMMRDLTDPAAFEALEARVASPQFAGYYDDTPSDIATQIDVCLTVARVLGYRGIFASVDVSWTDWVRRGEQERALLLTSLRRLLSTLHPLQQSGFGIKVVLPTTLGLSFGEIQKLVRGRVAVASYRWSEEEVRTLAQRYVRAMTEGASGAERLLDEPVWPVLYRDLCAIWEAPGPAAATVLAQQIVALEAREEPDSLQILRQQLYRQAAPIVLDPDRAQRTVWRGQRPIVLDEAPFRIFERLWDNRFNKTDSTVLRDLAGSQASLDQNIKRIRQRLEPLHDQSVNLYLKRSPGSGAWLDHFITLE